MTAAEQPNRPATMRVSSAQVVPSSSVVPIPAITVRSAPGATQVPPGRPYESARRATSCAAGPRSDRISRATPNTCKS